MSMHSIFTFEKDGVTFPVGVAVWSEANKDFAVKFLREETPGVDLGLVSLAEDRVKGWITAEKLPYSPAYLKPYHDEWWDHVAGLLAHRTKMSPARAIDAPRTAAAEVELLFQHAVTSQIPVVLHRVREIYKSLN